MSNADLTIFECQYDGMGDAILYCWIGHSAHAAGRTDVRINLGKRWDDIAEMFADPAWLTDEGGRRKNVRKGGPSAHWMSEVKNGTRRNDPRFYHWARFYGVEDVPAVRPPYHEDSLRGQKAEEVWSKRDRKTGSDRRVMLFPKCAWTSREWPMNNWIDLAAGLGDQGYNVYVMARNQKQVEGFKGCGKNVQFAWGHDLRDVAALIKRANLVVANDSGPAHLSGTIGTPTLALMGPTRPEIVFGHDPCVLGVQSKVLGCVGCHFLPGNGWRRACADGCRELQYLMPERVMELIDGHSAWKRGPEGSGCGAACHSTTGQGCQRGCGAEV